MNKNKIITTQIIEDVVNRSSSDRIPIRDLVAAMDSIGFGLALMIFSFGILIPLPPPFPSIISLPLVIFSYQMAIGRKSPKLPARFEKYTVKRSVLAALVQKSSPYIRKIEKILRPRMAFMISSTAERIVGMFALIFSVSVLLPLPLSNFVPGLGVLIISFGLLGKDGLIVLFGIITGCIGLGITVIVTIFGFEALTYIWHFITSWL